MAFTTMITTLSWLWVADRQDDAFSSNSFASASRYFAWSSAVRNALESLQDDREVYLTKAENWAREDAHQLRTPGTVSVAPVTSQVGKRGPSIVRPALVVVCLLHIVMGLVGAGPELMDAVVG